VPNSGLRVPRPTLNRTIRCRRPSSFRGVGIEIWTAYGLSYLQFSTRMDFYWVFDGDAM